jgi:xanthine/CO dehydrogenase XdhC/CoxF family maturation factor
MSELRQILELWRSARDHREEICLATVVGIEGSSYRKPGTRMLLTSGGGRAGTISGGCLERELQKKAWWLTESRATVQKYSTFVDEDSEMPHGLGCGGIVSVLLERGEPAHRTLAALEQTKKRREAMAIVYVIDANSPESVGCTLILSENGDVLFEAAASESSPELAWRALSERRSLWTQGVRSFFVDYVAPPAALLVFGAGDDAQPLVEFAYMLGWQVTVVDGRFHLATRGRFPLANEVVAVGSFEKLVLTERSAAVIMTHSYEQDRAVLRALLLQEFAYLGILGPRHRTEQLLTEIAPELGRTVEDCLSRLHSPVGLNIGARNPASIALAIIAEMHAVIERRGAETQKRIPIAPCLTLPAQL